jgi:hypothetical protein
LTITNRRVPGSSTRASSPSRSPYAWYQNSSSMTIEASMSGRSILRSGSLSTDRSAVNGTVA